MTSEITKFDAMAAWFNFSDKKDHFYLQDGTHIEVDFFSIESVMENKKYMKEIYEILEKDVNLYCLKRELIFS